MLVIRFLLYLYLVMLFVRANIEHCSVITKYFTEFFTVNANKFLLCLLKRDLKPL